MTIRANPFSVRIPSDIVFFDLELIMRRQKCSRNMAVCYAIVETAKRLRQVLPIDNRVIIPKRDFL